MFRPSTYCLGSHGHTRSLIFVNTCRIICKVFTADHFILQLDVGQLVFELGFVRSYYHLVGGHESQFKYKVGVQSLWIKNAVVGQDLMIEIDAILLAENFFQFVLSVNL